MTAGVEGLTIMEVASLVDEGLASLNVRLRDPESVGAEFPSLEGDDHDDLEVSIRRACDEWDRVADMLPGFRD